MPLIIKALYPESWNDALILAIKANQIVSHERTQHITNNTDVKARTLDVINGLMEEGNSVTVFGCYSNQLFGRFGDVVGTLYDLLRVVRRRFLTLALQTAGTGGQQTQGAADGLGGRPLYRVEGAFQNTSIHCLPDLKVLASLTLGNNVAISVTAPRILSEHGTKLERKTK